MKYKKTLQVLVICVVCELYALLFSALIYSCRGEGGRTEMRTEMENAVVTGNKSDVTAACHKCRTGTYMLNGYKHNSTTDSH